MVKKKSVARKVYPEKSLKKISTKGKKSSKKIFKKTKFDQKKFELITRKLIFFVIGFISSFILYFVSTNEVLEEIFGLLSIVFGFISIAFFIIFLIFLFMKFIKK